MNDEDEGEVIHMVPVPQKHLKLVYQTLARAMSEGETKMNTVPTRSGTLPFQNRQGVTWTKDNLEKLRNNLRSPAPLKMLELTAAQPGKPVYFIDLPGELGQHETQTRAQIGTLTKAIKRAFKLDYDDANWPVDIKWDENMKLMYYIMNKETAEAWRDLPKDTLH